MLLRKKIINGFVNKFEETKLRVKKFIKEKFNISVSYLSNKKIKQLFGKEIDLRKVETWTDIYFRVTNETEKPWQVMTPPELKEYKNKLMKKSRTFAEEQQKNLEDWLDLVQIRYQRKILPGVHIHKGYRVGYELIDLGITIKFGDFFCCEALGNSKFAIDSWGDKFGKFGIFLKQKQFNPETRKNELHEINHADKIDFLQVTEVICRNYYGIAEKYKEIFESYEEDHNGNNRLFEKFENWDKHNKNISDEERTIREKVSKYLCFWYSTYNQLQRDLMREIPMFEYIINVLKWEVTPEFLKTLKLQTYC